MFRNPARTPFFNKYTWQIEAAVVGIALPQPTVQCWRWAQRYFFIKEILWLGYFVLLHAWSALAGVVLFLLYPLWRRYYKASNPEIYGDASSRAA